MSSAELQGPEQEEVASVPTAALNLPLAESESPGNGGSPFYTPGGREYYTVSKILSHRNMKGEMHYFVRWRGYSPDKDAWIPASSFLEQQDNELVNDYWNWYKGVPKGQIRKERKRRVESP